MRESTCAPRAGRGCRKYAQRRRRLSAFRLWQERLAARRRRRRDKCSHERPLAVRLQPAHGAGVGAPGDEGRWRRRQAHHRATGSPAHGTAGPASRSATGRSARPACRPARVWKWVSGNRPQHNANSRRPLPVRPAPVVSGRAAAVRANPPRRLAEPERAAAAHGGPAPGRFLFVIEATAVLPALLGSHAAAGMVLTGEGDRAGFGPSGGRKRQADHPGEVADQGQPDHQGAAVHCLRCVSRRAVMVSRPAADGLLLGEDATPAQGNCQARDFGEMDGRRESSRVAPRWLSWKAEAIANSTRSSDIAADNYDRGASHNQP